MTPSQIARRHFTAALAESAAAGQDRDAVARAFISAALAFFLETRTLGDVRAELLGLADNLDPDADYAFMRP